MNLYRQFVWLHLEENAENYMKVHVHAIVVIGTKKKIP
jgi:hypothetical protein